MDKKIIGLTLILLFGLLLLGCTSSNTNNTTGTNNQPATNTQPSSKVYAVGEPIVLGNTSYTVNSVDQQAALGSEYLAKTASDGATYYLVEVKIQNTGNSEITATPSNDVTIIDSKERTYKPDLTLSMYAKQSGFETFDILEKIPAGISRTGVIVFEMPEGTTGQIKIKPSMFSGEATIEFK